jgi:hypothetical protein
LAFSRALQAKWTKPALIASLESRGFDIKRAELVAQRLFDAAPGIHSQKDAESDDTTVTLKSSTTDIYPDSISGIPDSLEVEGAKKRRLEPTYCKETQEYMLSKAISSCGEFLPMESRNLTHIKDLDNIIEEVKSAASTAALEELTGTVRATLTLMGQLQSSLNVALKEVKTRVRKRLVVKTKQEQDKAANMVAEKKKASILQEETEKKKMTKGKKMFPFQLDYSRLPAKLCVHTSDAALKEAFQKKEVDFSLPWLLEASVTLTGLISTSQADSKLCATMEQWIKQCPTNKFARQSGQVFAPLPASCGQESMKTAQELLLPELTVKSALPRFSARVDHPHLYGYTQIYCQTDFLSDLLAGVKVQFKGTCEFYCMPSTDICAALKSENTEITAVSMKEYMNSMSQESVTNAANNNWKLLRGTLTEGQALMVPAGWMVSEAHAGNDEVAAGILLSVLPAKAAGAAAKEFGALLENASFQQAWTQSLLDLIALHKACQEALASKGL